MKTTRKPEMKKRLSKIALVLFVLTGLGFSLWVAVSAIIHRSGKLDFGYKSRMPFSLPRSYPDYRLERSRILMKHVEREKQLLDSLSVHDSVRYQQILKNNPKLIENINSLETLFGELIKK